MSGASASMAARQGARRIPLRRADPLHRGVPRFARRDGVLRARQGRRNAGKRGRPPHLPQHAKIDDFSRAPELGRVLSLRLPQELHEVVGLAACRAGHGASREAIRRRQFRHMHRAPSPHCASACRTRAMRLSLGVIKAAVWPGVSRLSRKISAIAAASSWTVAASIMASPGAGLPSSRRRRSMKGAHAAVAGAGRSASLKKRARRSASLPPSPDLGSRAERGNTSSPQTSKRARSSFNPCCGCSGCDSAPASASSSP